MRKIYYLSGISILLLSFAFPLTVFGQIVEIFPDGAFSECPGEYITYTAEVSPSYSNGGCQFEWTVTNGKFKI